MKTSFLSLVAPALILLATVPAPSFADVKQIPVVRLETATEVAAAPQAVWNYMTTGKNLVTWCPVWKSPANAKINLSKVGDVLEFTDQWGNGGRSVVTFLKPNAEIRVAHEPADGSYLCQSRVILTPSGTGTHVVWIEQYTDESAAADRDATAAKMETDMGANLTALKTGVEKK